MEVGGQFTVTVVPLPIPSPEAIEIQAVIWQETPGGFSELYVLPLGAFSDPVAVGDTLDDTMTGLSVPYVARQRIVFGFRASATPGAVLIVIEGIGSGSYTVVSSI